MSVSRPRSVIANRILPAVKKLAPVFIVVLMALVGFFASHYLIPKGPSGEVATNQAPASVRTLVQLSPEKIQAAHLQSTPAATQDFRIYRDVVGVIRFDPSRYVPIRAPVSCVVQSTLAGLGQQAASGQPLVIASSGEVGAIRAQLKNAASDVTIAQLQLNRVEQTHGNFVELSQLLETHPDIATVERTFADRTLGSYRESLFTSYGEYLAARRLSTTADQLESSGILAGKTADERRQRLLNAQSQYLTTLEESRFQARQSLATAQANLEAAERTRQVVLEELGNLIGDSAVPTADDGDLSEFQLLAPRDGQIVAWQAAAAVRFQAGDLVAAIGDTLDVWVEAQVGQTDWQALSLERDTSVWIRIPDSDDPPALGQVLFTANSVSPATRSVPLTASIDNQSGRFRPGMLVSVRIPVSPKRSALVIPESAVQRDDSSAFVFVETAPGSYRRVDVEMGEQSLGVVEITHGLSPGDRVVYDGAFLLRSELLLEPE